jgi:predicted metalloprotease with PDZ domain
LLTPDEYLDEVEQLIALHVTSPVLRVPMHALATHADRRSAETAVVVRGALFATLLDARIRDRSKNAFSLDDLLRELFAVARERGGPLRPGLVTDAIANHLDRDTALELEARYLRGDETIVLPAHALGRCFRGKPANYPVFSLGFTSDGELRADDVAPNGPAARAGLKSGEPIRGLRYVPGRTDVRVVVSVERGEKWQELSYLPISGTARGQGFARVPGVPDEHCALRARP